MIKMPKKLKVNNCLDCGNHQTHPVNQEIICNHPGIATAKVVDTPLMVKVKDIIPSWCPLEDWNN